MDKEEQNNIVSCFSANGSSHHGIRTLTAPISDMQEPKCLGVFCITFLQCFVHKSPTVDIPASPLAELNHRPNQSSRIRIKQHLILSRTDSKTSSKAVQHTSIVAKCPPQPIKKRRSSLQMGWPLLLGRAALARVGSQSIWMMSSARQTLR